MREKILWKNVTRIWRPSLNLYRDILGRDPESLKLFKWQGTMRFFSKTLPELRQTSPVFSTFQQVLGRDPGLAGLEYYRNVRPDLMQDPRAFDKPQYKVVSLGID